MDKHFTDMIKLFSYGATGKPCEISKDADFEKIMAYANEQGVWQLVFFGADKLISQGKLSVDTAFYNSAKIQVMMSCLQKEEVVKKSHEIIKDFEKAGIKCCVLKGEGLARLYFKPECRISGDVDLYIGDGDDKTACEILYNHGYKIEPKSDDSNHYNCMHPQYGELELHTRLHYKIVQDTWFNSYGVGKNDFVKFDGYHTLEYTDNCIYTALHGINHFISTGFGVRHIMDFLLYLDAFYEKIDIQRFISFMKELKYWHFIEIMAGIGKRYFNMDCRLLYTYTDAETDKVMEEIFNGGLFGHKQPHINLFEIYTNMRIASQKGIDSKKYMQKWRRENVKKALSFAPERMYKSYPYSQKSPLLLPVAWGNHIGHIIKTGLTRGKLLKDVIKYEVPEKTDAVEKKITLLKELDMI